MQHLHSCSFFPPHTPFFLFSKARNMKKHSLSNIYMFPYSISFIPPDLKASTHVSRSSHSQACQIYFAAPLISRLSQPPPLPPPPSPPPSPTVKTKKTTQTSSFDRGQGYYLLQKLHVPHFYMFFFISSLTCHTYHKPPLQSTLGYALREKKGVEDTRRNEGKECNVDILSTWCFSPFTPPCGKCDTGALA